MEYIAPLKFGYCEGDTCNRCLDFGPKCDGVIELAPTENCSCHINPPCSACTSPRHYCPTCDWQEKDDTVVNDFVVTTDPKTGNYRSWERRKLDPTKIDYFILSHTHFSQICEGVCPEGTTMAEVLAEVKGTFGGRFDYFGNGRFRYIAYTD